MRIVVIIGNTSEPFKYFANTINASHKVDLLLIEKSRPQKNITEKKTGKSEKSLPGFLEKVLKYILFRIKMSRKKKLKRIEQKMFHEYCEKWFGSKITALDPDIPILEVDNINSPETQKMIAEINPELMLVHGSSLLKPEIIKLAKLALNLHWGLSPYYRGVNCTNHALVNWDIKNIGVTIHKLAVQIDGGDILGQARARIGNISDMKSATLQLTYLGTKIIIRAVDYYKNNKELYFVKQDHTSGFLFRGLHWDENIINFVESMDEVLLNKMITYPSRNEVPIIELR